MFKLILGGAHSSAGSLFCGGSYQRIYGIFKLLFSICGQVCSFFPLAMLD